MAAIVNTMAAQTNLNHKSVARPGKASGKRGGHDMESGMAADNPTEAEWTRIFKANEDILSGRALVVERTISGGRSFFRLRAGPFTGPIEAQNVCWALQARGQSCLVVVNG